MNTQIDTELQDSDDISVSVGNKYNPESSVLSRHSRETVNNNTDLNNINDYNILKTDLSDHLPFTISI